MGSAGIMEVAMLVSAVAQQEQPTIMGAGCLLTCNLILWLTAGAGAVEGALQPACLPPERLVPLMDGQIRRGKAPVSAQVQVQ